LYYIKVISNYNLLNFIAENEAVKNTDGDYYNVGPISHVIKTADLPSRYHTIKANKNILSKEFKVG